MRSFGPAPQPHDINPINIDHAAGRRVTPELVSKRHPRKATQPTTHVSTTVHTVSCPEVQTQVLTAHRAELVGHARRLLATSTDRYNRDRVLAAMKAWGHDTSDLENADDIATRERYARLKAERDSWGATDGTGGYSEDPPF
ncbi:hypothetical protein ABT116_30840 [Streptomyces sp. NPDC002130]|uniref:hypothetical protein n=1 Tax=Streptomyces sp. NPDC002130 TaxID=3155568 RepID=UPI003327E116